MAAVAILDFAEMLITLNWIELFAQNLVGRCITAMRRWHMTKTKPGTFLGDVIIMMNKDIYIMDECRENNRCADVKAYKSSQLTNL